MAARSAWLESHGLVPLVVSGAAEVMLQRRGTTPAASSPALSWGTPRWRGGRTRTSPGTRTSRYPHAYRWSDTRWDWWLGTSSVLTEAALAELRQRLAATT